ncbi:TIGR04255 family protein [Vannielia litorea]|uniref:TIGR04255 family protein n=1 Tax=Vannielia litorea TaxID=1217970 RepID=UPI001BCA8EEE|nr:TIGR04255 family protein [Vannielia litorea]MBS8225911.1 TIGR04255 family protein [Vannielia litorea]
MNNSQTATANYESPPLDEVVLGVQFEAIPDFTSAEIGAVRSLFSGEFPLVQEQPPLTPQFEVFGRDPGGAVLPRISLERAPLRSRMWFLSNEGNHLVQFQEDRFLLNWRRGTNGAEYPRFSGTSAVFLKNLSLLDEYVSQTRGQKLKYNQAEVSYINIIDMENLAEAGDWLRFLSFENQDIETVAASFSEVIRDETKSAPFARLHVELSTVLRRDTRKRSLRLGLTVRGRPTEIGQDGVGAFVKRARDRIVKRFGELTTQKASIAWRKIE